jgi:hypothetical protein
VSGAYITIGETRIKKSNIKTFGISQYQPKRMNADRLVNGIVEMFKGGGFSNGFSENHPSIRYLYVTTYQNDNYQFFENKINIDEVIKMLEGE